MLTPVSQQAIFTQGINDADEITGCISLTVQLRTTTQCSSTYADPTRSPYFIVLPQTRVIDVSPAHKLPIAVSEAFELCGDEDKAVTYASSSGKQTYGIVSPVPRGSWPIRLKCPPVISSSSCAFSRTPFRVPGPGPPKLNKMLPLTGCLEAEAFTSFKSSV